HRSVGRCERTDDDARADSRGVAVSMAAVAENAGRQADEPHDDGLVPGARQLLVSIGRILTPCDRRAVSSQSSASSRRIHEALIKRIASESFFLIDASRLVR